MPRLNDSRIGAVLAPDLAVRATTHTYSSSHSAHGVALFIGLEHDVEIRSSAGPMRGRAVLVASDVEHAVASQGPTIGICFDPERLPRVAGFARRGGPAQVLDGHHSRQLVGAATAHRAQLADPHTLAGMAGEAAELLSSTAVRIDPRVARVVEALREPQAQLPQLAISAGHLQELFTRDIGAPIRTVRLWHRLLRALVAFTTTDATTAAHAAGFSDLAHFSRTCRRMLGYSPTTLRDGV
ncbi:MAG TPA: helix-turn-helix domain-containing protein [Kofleriaceae bacterium]|jgi:AraC-like DNA-binding protein|nr:helix-turn-helix domain-containing protein [Kofleriaceae bacterium]